MFLTKLNFSMTIGYPSNRIKHYVTRLQLIWFLHKDNGFTVLQWLLYSPNLSPMGCFWDVVQWKYAANQSVATMWCYHVKMDINLWGNVYDTLLICELTAGGLENAPNKVKGYVFSTIWSHKFTQPYFEFIWWLSWVIHRPHLYPKDLDMPYHIYFDDSYSLAYLYWVIALSMTFVFVKEGKQPLTESEKAI